MSVSRYSRCSTNPGFIRLLEARPATNPATPKRVLLVEARSELRELLSSLLRRRGLEVTEQRPEETDLLHGCPYDAVVFNADQKQLRRQRWLFGYAPPRRRTRLVALHSGGDPDFGCHEVDIALPYPISMSDLVNAVLGD
jgi:CheY-like chemotaxis protein